MAREASNKIEEYSVASVRLVPSDFFFSLYLFSARARYHVIPVWLINNWRKMEQPGPILRQWILSAFESTTLFKLSSGVSPPSTVAALPLAPIKQIKFLPGNGNEEITARAFVPARFNIVSVGSTRVVSNVASARRAATISNSRQK